MGRSQAPAPKVRFFVGARQVFEKNTGRVFQQGDMVELFGQRLTVVGTSQVFDLLSESESTNVFLTEDSFSNVGG